jgi:hypothetical protein
MQQLGDHQVRHLIVDRRSEEDDPLLEQARVDIEGSLTTRVLLDHHRNQGTHAASSTVLRGGGRSPRSSLALPVIE